jgi:translation initiation factor 2-alpha kinase 4
MDMDLGLDELNDMDFLSVGHAKSVSFPSIHFGLDDDPSTHENSPIESKRSTRASSPAVTTTSARHIRTLYIQMEYVEKLTLKEAIEDGVTEMDCWRLMFQILSAMLHFTSLKWVISYPSAHG